MPHSTRASVTRAAIVVFVLAIGCASPPPPYRLAIAEHAEPISAWSMTCRDPHVLPRSCNVWSGASHRIRVGDAELAIAGSDDGTVVLVMVSTDATRSAYAQTHLMNYAAQRAIEALDRAGIAVRRARPVIGAGAVFGYALELDGDGYARLVAADETGPVRP